MGEDKSVKREEMSPKLFTAIAILSVIVIALILLVVFEVISLREEPITQPSGETLTLEEAMESVVDISISWEEDDPGPGPFNEELQRSGKGVILSISGNSMTIGTTPWVLGLEELSNSEEGTPKLELNYYDINCSTAIGEVTVSNIGFLQNDSCIAFIKAQMSNDDESLSDMTQLNDYISSTPQIGDTLEVLISGETRSLVVISTGSYEDPERNYYGAHYLEIDQTLDETFSGSPLFMDSEDGMRWVGLLEKAGRIVLKCSNYNQPLVIWYDNTREGIATIIVEIYNEEVSIQ